MNGWFYLLPPAWCYVVSLQTSHLLGTAGLDPSTAVDCFAYVYAELLH